eukprot:jgi/Tetstr1/449986/TSEL_037038.t1
MTTDPGSRMDQPDWTAMLSMTLLFSGDKLSAAAAGRWRGVLVQVLNGSLDRRDEYHMACRVALDNVLKWFSATAQLSVADFSYQDMHAVFWHSVGSMLGVNLEEEQPSLIVAAP